MIVYEEGKIVAVSKNLLNTLNIDIKEISKIIDQIELETAVLHQKTITIQNNSFKIEKEPLITLKNLTLFRLQKEKEEVIPNIIQQPQTEPEEKTETPTFEELNLIKMPTEEKEEVIPNIIQQTQTEPEEKTETPSFDELNSIKISAQEEEKEEVIPNIIQQPQTEPEEKTETPSFDKLNSIKISAQEEEKEEVIPNIIQQPQTEPEEKTETPNLDELNLIKIPTEEKEEIIPTLDKDKPLELDFEENISECEEILSQKNIKELIKKELHVAMEELGIDEEMVKELFNDLLQQIKEKKESFYKAIENKDYNELHEIAHYLKGASLNLRLSNLSFIFKTIDEESKKETNIETIKKLIDDFFDFLERFENEKINETQSEINISNENIKIDPKIKNLVLNTIQHYLETQDEQKFQKDKKFLEKLLNKNINSLQDLEYLWKDEQ